MKKRNYLFLFLLAAALLFGCGSEKAKKREERELKVDYSLEQMLLIGFSQRKQVEDIYTEKIWEVRMDEEGKTYREVFAEEMKHFFVYLKVLNEMAQERGLALDKEESAKIEKLSEEFYRSLPTDAQLSEKLGEEEVRDIFEQYALAQKLRDFLIEVKELEVSENEARVMQLQRMILEDREAADQVLFEVNAEGTDFYNIARLRSVDKEIILKVGHEDLPEEADQAVSLLGDGEISGIIEIEGQYHIYKCVVGYDEKATAEKKALLEKNKKDEVLKKAYDEYTADMKISMDAELWKKFVENIDSPYEGQDFFQAYKEAF